MKINSNELDILTRLRISFGGGNAIQHKNEEPFHSELYFGDQMIMHGEVVAKSHKLLKTKSPNQLLKRLDKNEETLLDVRKLLVENTRTPKSVAPAAEWLLDNFYLIEEQITIAKKHLPKGYSEGLPSLDGGNLHGMPRVYDIVLEIISHSDGRIDEKSLISFISSYQKHNLLTLGELWAIPIMLRLAVIENLRRVSKKIALHVIDNNLADFWTEALIETVNEEPANLILTISDMARSELVLSSPFVAGFIRRMQGTGSSLALPLSWMEQQLSSMGLISMDLVREDSQKQAADQVSVRNSIETLRFLGATDWKVFVETLSSVEQIFRKDINGIYPLMDFATRDRFRHMVETISKASPLSETEVAQKVLELATKHKELSPESQREDFIGYYLIDKGLRTTEMAVGMRRTMKQKLSRITSRRPVLFYLMSIAFLTLSVATGLLFLAYIYGTKSWLLLTFIGLLSISGSAQMAVSLVNWLSTIWIKPKILPRMDFSKGIPAEYRTLVVIPTMLSSMEYIDQLIESLEIRFLGNKENNLHFGLLTDFLDADTENMPNDQDLLELAKTKIESLNQKYKQSEEDIFFLFHRPRKWNQQEEKWMGYERKRGKLSALNAFIQCGNRDEFSLIVGELPQATTVKYVITLDSDTQLPRDSAWKCIATMAHPLNRAKYDPKKKRVTEGYGILQPRVNSTFAKESPSLYLRMQGNLSGIDPYTRVSSDVYQDVFTEGSFIGKGIYEVDIFEKSVNEVFRENQILSHDLIEGCYTRSGLISDVMLYEENPTQYQADVKRRYRWIRGDWQISLWSLPFIKAINGQFVLNKLSAISRWKIFDNLRRSLLPLTLILILLMGWLVLPLPLLWTLMIPVFILLPLLISAFWRLMHKPDDLLFKAHFSEVSISVRDLFFRFLFDMAVLPYEAFKYTDAVIRTNWRMIVIHKKLLEWVPSANASKSSKNDLQAAYSEMWVAPLMAIISMALILTMNPEALLFALPLLILWFVAPALAWQLSQPVIEPAPNLTDKQMIFLHKTARKIWLFFEQFVTEGENWLPPDNFQEEPIPTIAHRTSPTNIGLALLANLSAYDFGYIGIDELTLRSNSTFQTMLKLERYQGHFYNWYDTLSLLPLQPRYVSTVDTGNLIGHLLTLKQGLISLPTQPIFKVNLYEGIRTTTLILRDFSEGQHEKLIEKILVILDVAVNETNSLSIIKKHLDELILIANELTNQQPSNQTDFSKWAERLLSQIQRIREDLVLQIPWLELLPVPEHFADLALADQIPTLLNIQDMPEWIFEETNHFEQLENNLEKKAWLTKMKDLIEIGSEMATNRIELLDEMVGLCESFSEVDFNFLFNKTTSLLRIGFNVDDNRKDDSYYDLLASEARLGVFVAIAQGKLPQESWFALGRLLTNSAGEPILISWSGSMFEYLMPQLIMPYYDKTLLSQTCKTAVKRQIEYAEQRGVLWGISESAYNLTDANQNYQYRAFGVPGLGLKRGLEEDLVIAPYATMMALMVAPEEACANLQLLSTEGFEGEFGFHEAIDYTASRLPKGKVRSIIPSFMVHHQGMSLLSLAYLLLNKPMQQRFMAEPRFHASIMLLQERMPRTSFFYDHTSDLIEKKSTSANVEVRTITSANTRIPEIQLLSNGSYQVMITNSGGGYSRWKDIAVTRWREDVTKDDHGIFCYIKDVESGIFWSNTYQPTLQPAKNYRVIFAQGQVEFFRHDYGIDTKTEIVISPEDDTETRRMRITNRTQNVKILEITSLLHDKNHTYLIISSMC